MIYLIPGNHREATLFMKELDLNRHNTVEILEGNPLVLVGRRITKEDAIIRIGTWWRRNDLLELEDLLSVRTT